MYFKPQEQPVKPKHTIGGPMNFQVKIVKINQFCSKIIFEDNTFIFCKNKNLDKFKKLNPQFKWE